MADLLNRLMNEAGVTPQFAENFAGMKRFAELVAEAEREACIDLVAFHGGPVDLEAAIRARGAQAAGGAQ